LIPKSELVSYKISLLGLSKPVMKAASNAMGTTLDLVDDITHLQLLQLFILG